MNMICLLIASLKYQLASPMTGQEGHDVVIGGCLRPDKAFTHAYATASGMTFLGRRQRLVRSGGGVWQHLRSFRKGLFDRIADTDLRQKHPSLHEVGL